MSDTATAPVEAPTTTPTPDEAIGQTTFEHDGRVFTGTQTDEDATVDAFVETTQGKKAEAEATKAGKPIRGQKRFDQLTYEREEARRDADKARSEAATLKAELEALRSKPQDPPKEEAPKPKADAKARPKLEDFLEHKDPLGAFNEALGTYYESEIDARISTRLEAERASRQLSDTVADTWERGSAAHSDFEAVLQQSDVKLPEPILWQVYHDPNAEHIIYALASDDELAKQVSAIRDPIELGRVLGRLGTASLGAASPASSEPAAKSKAPRPFQPVSGASRTASKSLQELAESGDVDAYKARRHAELGIKAR